MGETGLGARRDDDARSDLAARFPRENESSSRMARSSIVMAVLAALGFGLFFLGVQESARYDALWSTFAARSASVTGLTIVSVRLGTPLLRGGAWRPLVAIGLLDVGANTLYAIATRHGLLSLVSVAASVVRSASFASGVSRTFSVSDRATSVLTARWLAPLVGHARL